MMSGWQRVFLDDRKVPIMIKGINSLMLFDEKNFSVFL